MKANELRIGNYFKVGQSIRQVEIENIIDYKVFEPIPLTEEWLLKFGFVKDGIWFNYSFGFYSIGISKDQKGFHFSYDDGFIQAMHVHQLQNLIFALTGCELEIK